MSQVRFNVYDDVIVRGRERGLGTVIVPNLPAQPGHALVAFDDGIRELIPHNMLEPAPDGAAAQVNAPDRRSLQTK